MTLEKAFEELGAANRIVIVGGPRCGKSTLARLLREARQLPTFCGDPRSMVKEPEDNVTYLPEGLHWSDSSQFVADHWLGRPGPFVCEGQVMARALRKYQLGESPCDLVVVMTHQLPGVQVSAGQAHMHKAVMTVWREVAPRFGHLAIMVG